jgi:hypothetical protein
MSTETSHLLKKGNYKDDILHHSSIIYCLCYYDDVMLYFNVYITEYLFVPVYNQRAIRQLAGWPMAFYRPQGPKVRPHNSKRGP